MDFKLHCYRLRRFVAGHLKTAKIYAVDPGYPEDRSADRGLPCRDGYYFDRVEVGGQYQETNTWFGFQRRESPMALCPKTCFSKLVVWAAGLLRIFCPSWPST